MLQRTVKAPPWHFGATRVMMRLRRVRGWVTDRRHGAQGLVTQNAFEGVPPGMSLRFCLQFL